MLWPGQQRPGAQRARVGGAGAPVRAQEAGPLGLDRQRRQRLYCRLRRVPGQERLCARHGGAPQMPMACSTASRCHLRWLKTSHEQGCWKNWQRKSVR